MHRIDYLQVHNFHGTALQQQLHREYCDIVEQAADKQAQLPYQSDLLKQCVVCADAACDANQLGQIKTVVSLNNLGFALLEYGQAVITGTQLGIKGLAHTISNLDQAAESVGKAVCYVLETVALNNYTGSEDRCIQFRDQRNAEIMQGLKKLGHMIADSTGPQRVQAVTQFVVDWYGIGKIANVVGGVLGATESAAVKGARAGEQVGVDVAKTVQTAKVIAEEKIAQSVAKELVEAESQSVKSANLVSGHSSEAVNQFKNSLENLLKDLAPGRETTGRAKQYIKNGSYEDAVKDFYSLKPSNVQNFPGKEGLRGILPDGRNINVRLESTVKIESCSAKTTPTIEIMNPGGSGNRIKIRYNNKL